MSGFCAGDTYSRGSPMTTEGIVLGTLTQHGEGAYLHTYLEWVCPDCGNSGHTGVSF